jgi:phosphatidyl-myo-inositol dimannoside synthase
MQRIAAGLDVVTYISEYTRARLAPALAGRTRLAQLSPGVDVELFTPEADGGAVRRRLGLGDAPVVVCVSRLVARKGQDVLVAGWSRVLSRHPRARLLLVGGGPAEGSLRRAVAARRLTESVVFTGPVTGEELPAYYAAGDVFAMPCRTRRAGLDVEGLGMVFLEAAACGRPVVAGTSGGAPEAVREGITGHVVDPRSPDTVADVLSGLLDDPGRARTMGRAGRAWVEERWSWTSIAATLADLLDKP